jgi:hypothetical protein
MPFICPECEQRTLAIREALELPPDSRSDEVTLQIVTCEACAFAGLAVYEESRRGSLESESVDHRGYRVGAAGLRAIRRAMRRCPRPRDARCGCAAHRELGRRDASGRWDGLGDIELGDRFAMAMWG